MTGHERFAVALSVLALGAAAVGAGIVVADTGGSQGPPAGVGHGAMTVTSEFAYLAGMIPHHDEAIASAKILRAGTAREEMKRFVADIIRTQSAEVRRMKAWLAAWYPGRDTTVEYTPMMRDLSGLTGDALDRAFLEDMVHHHMMAVMMSQQLLVRGLAEHRAVVPFARKIRDVQRREIRMMRRWLADWFGTPGGPHHGGGMMSGPMMMMP